MIRCRTASLPEITSWPDALPKPNEQYYFSITSCGNSIPMWGFHDVNDEENATIWSNPLLDEKHIYDSSRTISERVEDLCSYVTTEVRHGMRNPCHYIFGENCSVSLESAAWEAVSRGCKITVYIVGTNKLQLELISKLFAIIPSRVYLMKSADFFVESDMSSNNIEVDRLAALRGAAYCKGLPSILFDAGDFLTYTAADEEGRILGGGVSQGLSSRIMSMNKRDADAITTEDLDVILEEVVSNDKELDMFPTDTADSVVAAAVSEVSCHIINVVRMWREKVRLPSGVVSFTGKHGGIAEKLLQEKNGGLIESLSPGSAPKVNTFLSKHFIPDGIQSAISDQMKHINKRVAKEVTKNDYKKGVVQSIVNNDYGIVLYAIKFDDGSTDQASLKMIIEMNTLYKKIEEGTVTSSKITTTNGPSSTTQKRKRGRPCRNPPPINGQVVKLETVKKSRRISACSKHQLEDKKPEISVSDEFAHSYLGKKVAKTFGSKLFTGEVIDVVRHNNGSVWWKVLYDDGDKEDLNVKELDDACNLFNDHF